MKLFYLAITSLFIFCGATSAAPSGAISTEKVEVSASEGFLNVNADILLDGLKLGADKQIFITPVVRGDENEEVVLPSILVNGRNMHYAYERGSLKNFEDIRRHEILSEVRRFNGKPQKVEYTVRTPLQKWMRGGDARVAFVYDSCGCGVQSGSLISQEIPLHLNPVTGMRTAMMTPAITELPVEIHEGRARVQFEVDRSELHTQPYT